ncbi:hypothetical protein GCM10017044_10380 [Kordiimonas sediminis]|uniref:Solute-binding protein family 3/N-terminal domain-containing protein n=1 Tax=Kordiimonas sediminis TaxID=1735581 RepID=A0A919E6H2_9PROT|nr:transporter substrate-binding domain-containing protein [Kordiimonas sediminis]GHF17849.1 hypothetical protein GCM10017044_10380 [Kordiimonas sediminis]
MIRKRYFSLGLLFVASFLGAYSASAAPKTPVVLFLDSTVSLTTHDGSASRFGEIVKTSKQFLRSKDVPYEIKIQPWRRILRDAETQQNGLIIGLIRSPEREEHFHWLHPLLITDYKLIARNTEEFQNLDHDSIISGKYTVVCETESAQCDMLSKFGFKEENILQLAEAKAEGFESLLLHGRIDFIVSDMKEVNNNLKNLGHSEQAVIPVATVDASHIYLAGSKSTLDPKYLEILMTP